MGSIICNGICSLALDRLYMKLRDSDNGPGRPESRLPLAVIGALGVPAAVMIYGWAAQLHLPLPVLLFSLTLLGMSASFSAISIHTYVVDAFGIYAASATAAVIVTRCVMGAFVPLLAAPLVTSFGYGLGFSVLSAASLLIAPIPMLVIRHGARWRQSCSYTKDE